MKNIVFIVTSILIFQVGFAQVNLWTPSKTAGYDGVGYQIETVSDLYFEFDLQSFQEKVKNMPDDFVISLPIDKTTFADFKLNVNTTMSEGLMEKFPSLRAFDGKSLDHSGRTAKIDIGPNYFRAMILQPGGEDLFIDPVVFNHAPQSNYMLYSRNELISTKEFSCLLESQNGHDDKLIPVEFNQQKSIQSCELRTYRLAVSATGEYTIFHGGTVAGALAAQVTTMNRVNGIYERDLAVTMTLIPNNDLLIFTNPSTDPFTNGQPGAMINENPDVVDDAIGSSNYDIGHVFGTNSGGLAYLNSVCKSYKAGGVTGSGAPIGDPFDIDYVSHEMGHQFGANHTFNNSCNGNRNNGTAMEPGSGSTIMAYAGICSPNV
ncbi:MAG TPA: zinc-dependent metalloprotease family protein [Brumimicrobium sp.]|nr:zinc-dependent metalloprotease family protein [Brumimicrobium sp.]